MAQSGIAASIGIDIGASKENIGVLDANGAILAKTKIDIRGFKNDSDATLEAICIETAKVVDGAGIILDGKIYNCCSREIDGVENLSPKPRFVAEAL